MNSEINDIISNNGHDTLSLNLNNKSYSNSKMKIVYNNMQETNQTINSNKVISQKSQNTKYSEN